MTGPVEGHARTGEKPRWEIAVRPMREADLDQVMAMAEGLKEVPHWTREAYLRAVDPGATPARVALVAQTGAQIVGFLVAAVIAPEAELENIGVAAREQRKGIGRLLFDEFCCRLEKNAITEVILEVRESNRAARVFYASLGFVERGRRRAYYAEPKEDAILLGRRDEKCRAADRTAGKPKME